MRSHWLAAALLTTAMVAGCGRNTDNSQNPEQNQAAAPVNAPTATDQTVAPAPPAEAPPASAPVDTSAVRAPRATNATRPTSGRRDVAPAPSRNQSAQGGSTYSNAPAVGLPPRENRAAENSAPSAPAPRVPEFREVTIPAGTSLPLTMTSAISSETAEVEAPVSAKLSNAVTVNGDTVIPAGSIVSGNVTDVERSGRVQGRAHIAFAFSQVRMNGGREDLKTNPLTFQADATKTKDAEKVGIGAAGGAILGGILGGKKGAGKGAIAGGAAGTGVVLATRGEEVTVSEGTSVTATLASPMTVRIPVR
jgi:hypothetical protein